MQNDNNEIKYEQFKYDQFKYDQFKLWCIVYENHLKNMYNIFDGELNKYKVKIFNNIELIDFLRFSFDYSSQYISPYI